MRPRWNPSLTQRLVIAQVLVVIAMAVTVVVVAAAIGPAEFDHHMRLAGVDQPMVLEHAQEGFAAAGLAALAMGLTIAGAGAVTGSVLLSRRIGRELKAFTDGAERVAAGDYSTPVVLRGSGQELERVASGFNTMASRIAATEDTRRRMLTDLSHELRTPIAAIEVVLEGLEDGVVDAAEVVTALRPQAARLARLAADMREVSAAEEGRIVLHRAPTRLPVLLEAALGSAAPAAAAAGVVLELGQVPDVAVEVDRGRIGQVLDNLIRNALQHSARGGHVHLSGRTADGFVAVHVKDDGSGISATDLPHVFERFYRGDTGRRHDQGAGTGVGLAISRAILAAHGGTLSAFSAGEGQGAEFVLTLPTG